MKSNQIPFWLMLTMCSLFVGSMTMFPYTTSASSARPTCTIEATTEMGSTRVHDGDTVLVRKGSTLVLSWSSQSATKATDKYGRTLPLSGQSTSTPSSNTSYTYRFSRGSARATCEIDVVVVSGTITGQKSGDVSNRPTIRGGVRGATTVELSLYSIGTTTPTYQSGLLRARSSAWSTTITKNLPDGQYTVMLESIKDNVRLLVATSSLRVGTAPIIVPAATTVVVLPIPLLIGGVAHQSASVAVAYLQVINIGKATSTIAGFTVTQTGTAAVASVVGLTAVTDNGVARGSVGTMLTGTPFVGSSAFVPLGAVLAPGEMRLVTMKAVMNPLLAPYLGTTLGLVVSSITANAALQTTLPIRGTTWTIGL